MHRPNTCPKCKVVPLVQPSGRATRTLRCPSCRGTWLPSNEARIEAVAGLMEADDTLRPGAAADSKTGLCPLGHGILIRARVDVDDPFYLDRCAECGGIWFDAGEWNRLAVSHLLEHLDDLWDPARRFKIQQERADAAFRGKLEQQLGEEAFRHLEALARALKEKPSQLQLAALAHLRESLEVS